MLGLLLDFVEGVELAPRGKDDEDQEEEDEDQEEQSLGSIKGGLIKSVVAVVGSDEVAERLFEQDGRPEGFLERMKGFLKKGQEGEEREDLVICWCLLFLLW